jgi:hypothetical protein
MPRKSDQAIKFLTLELGKKKLDPRLDSQTVLDLYKDDGSVTPEVRQQFSDYCATKKSKAAWQSYWSRLRKIYLNEFENLNPTRNGPGPGPITYPRPTVRFDGDIKGTEAEDNEPPTPRPKASSLSLDLSPSEAATRSLLDLSIKEKKNISADFITI